MRRLLFCLLVSAVSCSQPAAREMSEGALEAPAAGDSILLTATAALQNGQPWRAAQILEPVLRDSAQRTPERVLLAARAAAEWGRWGQVDRLLAEEWLDSRFRMAATAARAPVSRSPSTRSTSTYGASGGGPTPKPSVPTTSTAAAPS